MRDYGIIRQNPSFRDMFAFPFLNDISFDDIDTINEVYPEWTDGKFYSGFGESNVNTPASNAGMRAGVYHNTDYDIVIIGSSRAAGITGTIACGCRVAADSGAINPNMSCGGTGTDVVFVVFKSVLNQYIYISQSKNNNLPTIGIKLKDNSRSLQNMQEQMKKSEDDPEPVKEQEPEEEEPVTKSTRKKG